VAGMGAKQDIQIPPAGGESLLDPLQDEIAARIHLPQRGRVLQEGNERASDPSGASPEHDSGRRWPIEGTLGEPARSRLFGRLAEATGTQRVFYFYGIGATVVAGKYFLFEAAADELEAVQQLANAKVEPEPFPIPGPEYVWPSDRSWIVITDYDLVSTYIACDANLAALLLRTDGLELLPVTLETRIDNRSDTVNGPRSAE